MKLFDIVDGEIKLNPQALALAPFRVIWEADEDRTKENATKEIQYVVFLCDFDSPYRDYVEGERVTRIKEDVFNNVNWEETVLVKEAIKRYEEFQETTNTRLLKRSKIAAEKLAIYFENVDFDKVDDKGKPIYSARELVATLAMVGNLVRSLTILENQVKKERIESVVVRGGSEVGPYEA